MLLLNAPAWIAQTLPLTDAIVCGVGAGGTFARATEGGVNTLQIGAVYVLFALGPAHLGGGEVLGNVASSFARAYLVVSAPGNLHPPPSLSLIYYYNNS